MEPSTALTQICADLWRDPNAAQDMAEFTLGRDSNGDRYRILLMNGTYHLEATDDIEGHSAHTQARWEPGQDPTGMLRFHHAVRHWLISSDVRPSREMRAANVAAWKADRAAARERFRNEAIDACLARIREGTGCSEIEGVKTIEEYGTARLTNTPEPGGIRWTLTLNHDTIEEQTSRKRRVPMRIVRALADLLNPSME